MAGRPDVVEALQILGVPPSAELPEVRRRFRRLARDLHPDRGGDREAFQELEVAVRVVREAHERGELPRRRPPQTRRGAPGYTATRPRDVNVDEVDWDRDLPASGGASRLDRDLLAVAIRDRETVRASSRGPRTPLNALTPMLSTDLTATIVIRQPGDAGAEVDVTVRRGSSKQRLLDADLPAGWSRVRENRAVTARRSIAGDPDERVTALRAATAVETVLARLDWPLSRWWLEG